jgi:serine phosphatase RsbU (regulator of sigma subunit)
MPGEEDDITLRVLSGPYGDAFTVRADGPATLGRAVGSDVCLLHEGVSRHHAEMVRRDGIWYIRDAGSLHGTYLNGVKLVSAPSIGSVPVAIASGDLLRIGPWTFRIVVGANRDTTANTIADAGATIIRADQFTMGASGLGADRRLRLLTECLTRLGQAQDEDALARLALESVVSGSGFSRGAVLKPVNDGRQVAVVASMRGGSASSVGGGATRPVDAGAPSGPVGVAGGGADFPISRSLIQAASRGQAVILSAGSQKVTSESIAGLGIHSAICAPVFLGEAVAAYLYLDARARESSVQAEMAGFCEAVASAYGLALANLKRAELERRQLQLAAELTGAHEAQQFILPPPQGHHGFLRYAMKMRPGVFVAGDLFDVVPLADGRVAVFLGDVAGHGAASGMLMATAQAFLHSQLSTDPDPAAAVATLNRYLSPRPTAGRFVSLWLGVFSPDGTLEYVDAGHGYWLHKPAVASARARPPRGGIPIGIEPGETYRATILRLAPGDRVIAYSDGIVEQRNSRGEQFGAARLDEAVRSCDETIAPGAAPPPASRGAVYDDVERIFQAVDAFAGRSSLDDDATVASIEFAP